MCVSVCLCVCLTLCVCDVVVHSNIYPLFFVCGFFFWFFVVVVVVLGGVIIKTIKRHFSYYNSYSSQFSSIAFDSSHVG